MVTRIINHIDSPPMSQISEPSDLEAQIEALIKQAGDKLRQQVDDVRRDHAAAGGQDRAAQPGCEPAPAETADMAAPALERGR
jgi:hypothetical protein